jgi:opacity protein-like surface antigen
LTAALSALALASPAVAASGDQEVLPHASDGSNAQANYQQEAGIFVRADAQTNYEKQLSMFLSANPQPQAVDQEAPAIQQNAYWKSMAAWWESVPWDAVAGQWGCVPGVHEVRFNLPDEKGVVGAVIGGVTGCGAVVSDQVLSALALPIARSTQQSAFGTQNVTVCSPWGLTYRHCLITNGGLLTAQFTYYSSGNITGSSRAGLVGAGQPCAQGSLIALGPIGIGSYGSSWSATGSYNLSTQYSASFVISYGVYSRYCDVL